MTWRLRVSRLREQALRHETLLWWVHSLYALALGVTLMWLGARHFTWLRVAAFHILAIWTCSLLLANYVDRPDHTSNWWTRARVAINYVTKNFYQQVLFFILPIYAASATLASRNVLFVVVLGASAVVSTLDVIYDRHVSARRRLTGVFFAFNLFAVINVALPVLWSLSNLTAQRVGTLAAVLGYITLARRPTDLTRSRTWRSIGAGALVVLVSMELMRSFVPPAPLHLAATEFGLGLDRQLLRTDQPIVGLTPGYVGRVYVVTALEAPMGLRDRVEMRWYLGAHLLWASQPRAIVGGRKEGFRLWSSVPITRDQPLEVLRLDVVTEGGQLIGRASLPVRVR
jgi:heme/copper-type cytochrome/quinol oxidase subunit 4